MKERNDGWNGDPKNHHLPDQQDRPAPAAAAAAAAGGEGDVVVTEPIRLPLPRRRRQQPQGEDADDGEEGGGARNGRGGCGDQSAKTKTTTTAAATTAAAATTTTTSTVAGKGESRVLRKQEQEQQHRHHKHHQPASKRQQEQQQQEQQQPQRQQQDDGDVDDDVDEELAGTTAPARAVAAASAASSPSAVAAAKARTGTKSRTKTAAAAAAPSPGSSDPSAAAEAAATTRRRRRQHPAEVAVRPGAVRVHGIDHVDSEEDLDLFDGGGGAEAAGFEDGGIKEDASGARTTSNARRATTATATAGTRAAVTTANSDHDPGSDSDGSAADLDGVVDGPDRGRPAAPRSPDGPKGARLPVARAVADEEQAANAAGGSGGAGVAAVAVEYDPARSKEAPFWLRRKSGRAKYYTVYLVVGLLVLTVALVALTVGIVHVRRTNPPPSTQQQRPSMVMVGQSQRGPKTQRTMDVESRIASAVGTDAMRYPAPARQQALEWITYDDPMQLSSRAPNLVQRYTLAYLYYALTSQDGPWWQPKEQQTNSTTPANATIPTIDVSSSCDPTIAASATSSTNSSLSSSTSASPPSSCLWPKLSSIEPILDYQQERSYRWFSNVSECFWAGITCSGIPGGGNSEYVDISEIADMSHPELMIVDGIDLGGAGVSGTFPEGIVYLPFLRSLSLSLGTLHGPLPSADLVMRLPYLNRIDLSHNKMTGPIPAGWWALSTFRNSLQSMILNKNELTGTIPPQLSNLINLKRLRLGQNQFTGSIPTEIGLLDGLVHVDLAENRIRGTVPEAMTKLRRLRALWLHNNRLSGPIPSSIGLLSDQLEDLSLRSNPLMKGTLPESLYNLTKLVILDIRDCNFTGTISSSIENLQYSLEVLHISNNKFHGTLPLSLASLNLLQSFWVQGNAFTGEVPESFCESASVKMKVQFSADCSPDPQTGYIELACSSSCCTHCCLPDGTQCFPTTKGV